MEKIQVHHIRALKDLNKAALRILWWDSTSLHCRVIPQGLFKKQVFIIDCKVHLSGEK